MERKRNRLVCIEEAYSDLGGPLKALREASPQAFLHFTRFDQLNQSATTREEDPDMGFMARLMVLRSLPSTIPGNQLHYKRVNGPYTLVMFISDKTKLPYGNLTRLLLAYVSTQAPKPDRELVAVNGTESSGDAAAVQLRSSSLRP